MLTPLVLFTAPRRRRLNDTPGPAAPAALVRQAYMGVDECGNRTTREVVSPQTPARYAGCSRTFARRLLAEKVFRGGREACAANLRTAPRGNPALRVQSTCESLRSRVPDSGGPR